MNANADVLRTLRQVNGNVRSALERLRPEQTRCSAIRPGELSELLAELLRAGECLRSLAGGRGTPVGKESQVAGHRSDEAAALESETREYRSNLQKLMLLLPDLHVRLLAEKARLQSVRSHIGAAAAWARASTKSF